MVDTKNNGRRFGLSLFLIIALSAFSMFTFSNYASAETVYIYDNISNDNGRPSFDHGDTHGYRFQGVRIGGSSTLIDEEFNRIDVVLRRNGSPSGTVYVGVWSTSTTPTTANVIELYGTIDSAIITTGTTTYYNFTGQIHTIAADEVIGFLYPTASGGSDHNNWISGRYSSASSFDGTNTYQTYVIDAGTFEDHTGEDLVMALSLSNESCPVGWICFDFNNDGEIDHQVEDANGDNVIDFDVSDIPAVAAPISETAPNFIRAVTGLSLDGAILAVSMIIHAIAVFGIGGGFFVLTKHNPPFFVWAFLMILGGGLSVAVAGMPLLFFFVEVALVVGGVAALVKTGVIGA